MRKDISYTWAPKEIKPIKPMTGIEVCILLPKIFIFVIITLKLLILFGIFQMFNLRGLNNFILKAWSKFALFLCRFQVVCKGSGIKSGLIVSNHISWIDILAIMSIQPGRFVAKSEVGRWFIFGNLAKVVGTIFIERNPAKILKQLDTLEEALKSENLVILFPEGTSSDGQRILPFNSGLFQAVYQGEGEKKHSTKVQSLTIYYCTNDHLDKDFFAWYHSRTLAGHIFKVLGTRHRSKIYMTFGNKTRSGNFSNRKELTQFLFNQVLNNFSNHLSGAIK